LSFLESKASPHDTSQALMLATEQWLQRRAGWFPRLPPQLLAAYDRQTRHERSRTAGIIGLIGSAIAVATYPALTLAMPDLRRDVTAMYLFGAIPVSLAVALLVLLDPRPLLREILLGLAMVVNTAVLTYLFATTRTDATALYAASILLLMLFATVTVQLRFSVALGVTIAIVALNAVGLHFTRAGSPALHMNLLLVSVAAGGYMMFANWRMQVDQQRSFVLTMRERMRRRDLFQRNQELGELLRRDALTGLANRRAYDAWLLNSWRQARDAAAPLGLIVIDVDQFKAYNDFYGHPAGDTCLQTVARCLRDQLRGTSDHVARMGGEEFAVLLPGLRGELCADIAERLRAAVASLELPHLDNEQGRIVTISCGAASLLAQDATTPRDLVAAADAALYHAKQTGRNRVCMADAAPAQKLPAMGDQPPIGNAATGLA
jgi:diguanylate cyclase (GGDEF)-like protein